MKKKTSPVKYRNHCINGIHKSDSLLWIKPSFQSLKIEVTMIIMMIGKIIMIQLEKRNGRQCQNNEITTIVWTIHNLLNLYCYENKFELNNNSNDIKTFILFLNTTQTTFKLLVS